MALCIAAHQQRLLCSCKEYYQACSLHPTDRHSVLQSTTVSNLTVYVLGNLTAYVVLWEGSKFVLTPNRLCIVLSITPLNRSMPLSMHVWCVVCSGIWLLCVLGPSCSQRCRESCELYPCWQTKALRWQARQEYGCWHPAVHASDTSCMRWHVGVASLGLTSTGLPGLLCFVLNPVCTPAGRLRGQARQDCGCLHTPAHAS